MYLYFIDFTFIKMYVTSITIYIYIIFKLLYSYYLCTYMSDMHKFVVYIVHRDRDSSTERVIASQSHTFIYIYVIVRMLVIKAGTHP